MSEQKKSIADNIVELFDGEIKETALKFIAYLDENQLTPKQSGNTDWKIPFNECYLCEIRLEPNKWTFLFYYGEYSGEFDEGFITTVGKHLNFCTSCNNPCTSGKDTTVFGTEYKNVCTQLPIEIENPNSKTLEDIKKLIEYSKKIVSNSLSWHAQNNPY